MQAGAPATTNCARPLRYLNAWSEGGVLVIGGAQYDNVGFLFESGIDTLLHGVKSEVVNDFVSGASEEIAGELSTSQTHSQVAYSEHEYLGTVGSGFGSQTELLEIGSCTLGWQSLGGVAFGCASALTFVVFDFDFVGGHFVDIGVLVGAKKYLLTASYVGVAFLGCFGYGLLYGSVSDFGEESTGFVYGKEEFPSFASYGYGECLYVVGTACGVDNLVHVRFLFEQELLVAGDTFRERVRFLVRSIERCDGDGVDTGDGCGHCFGLTAQKVDVCVKDCLVVARGGGVYHHLGCGFVCGLVLFDDVGPKHTSGAEFGDFHKKVGGYAHIEFDATGGFIDAYAGLGEGCHPLCAPSQCVSEFFVDERACIAEHCAVDINNAECGNVLDDLDEGYGLGYHAVTQRGTVAQGFAQGIESDASAESFSSALCLDVFYKGFGYVNGFAGAAVEVDFDFGQVDAIEQRGNICCLSDLKAKGCDAASEHIACIGIGLLGIFGENLLTGIPIIVGACTAYVRELSRKRVGRFEVFDVFYAIDRLDIESFVGSPYQLFVEIGTLEVRLDFLPPLIIADGRELVE